MKLFSRISLFACLLFLVFMSISMDVRGQKYLEDVIYLKNGGVLRGQLLPQDSVGIIRIEILGENILAFPVSEVQTITREPKSRVRYGKEKTEISYKQRGYYNLSQVGLAVGGVYYNAYGYEERNQAHLGLQFINGYQFHRFASAGLGVGIDLYPQGPMLPVFLDVRGDLLKKPATPHFYGHIGYSQPLYNLEEDGWRTDSQVEGGLLYAAGIGVKFHTRGSLSFLLSMGYRSQAVTESYSYLNGDRISQKVTYQRISLQAGLMF